MKPNQSQTSILMLVVIVCMNAFAVGLLLDSKRQRSQATADRKEIICILKLLPEESQRHPGRVDKCRGTK